MRLAPAALLALLVAGCAPAPKAADPAALDPIAARYVSLVLSLGEHDPNYVDAYYGPDSVRTAAKAAALPLAAIRAAADSLLAILSDSVPAYADSLVAMRHRYLHRQLGSLVARARMLGGERFTFDQEAEALYGMTPPHLDDAHFDSLLARLDAALPGAGPLADRYQRFRTRVTVPAALVDTVFRTAIAACRSRTAARMPLPEGESFTVEYVKGNSWSAYNWYKGNYHSLIQVSLDLPITIDRMIDLACHEGYPGHHVYNASLEQALVRGRGWVEYSVYPLFSPQSAIAEGSGNYGIEMAFPGGERTAFERDSLFPLAQLDPALAETNGTVRDIITALNYARNEVARRYLDGAVDSAAAAGLMGRYWLQNAAGAAKTVHFIRDYRSYVINYNVGMDLVGAWVTRQGADPAARWHAFRTLLASPRLPADLR